MKILLVSSSSGSRGGGELYLLYLGESLLERGHEVTLWVSEHSRMDELAQSFSRLGKVIRARYQNTYDRPWRSIGAFLDFKTARNVGAEWTALAPDCLLIIKQNLEDGLDLLRAANQTGIPAISMIHITQSAKYLRARFSAARDAIARSSLKRFRGLLVTTPEIRRRDLSVFLGDEKHVRMVPTGVPLYDLSKRAEARNQQRASLQIDEAELLIIAAGRMEPQKRPLLFLEIAAQIRTRIPAAQFLWIGDGSLSAEWDRMISSQNLSGFIRRVPWQKDVEPFYHAGDVLLHTARFEGLSIALLESMSAELPIAALQNLRDEMPFLNETNSIAIDATDSWIEELRERNELRAKGIAARRMIEENFSFGKMAGAYETLYEELRSQ